MLPIADREMTEYRNKIYDHLVATGDQKMLSGGIYHIQHSRLQHSHPVICGTEEPHQQQLSSTINFYHIWFILLILYLVCGCLHTIGNNKTWLPTEENSHSKASENTDPHFTEDLTIFLASRCPNNFQSPQLTAINSLLNCSLYMMQYSDR